jgi:thioesterase domain-containing protein
VHGGDGSAMNLRVLAERLREAAQVHGIDSAYVCGPPPHPRLSMQELADFYADHVGSVVPPGDALAVGGWSFGGAIGFEMARELRRRGYRVAACFAIDAGPARIPPAAL